MSYPFTGRIDGSVTSSIKNLPTLVDYYAIINNGASSVVVNVYKIVGSAEYRIAPANLAIASGEMYESQNPVVVLASQQIKIQTSGSVDYDFTFSNLKPDAI